MTDWRLSLWKLTPDCRAGLWRLALCAWRCSPGQRSDQCYPLRRPHHARLRHRLHLPGLSAVYLWYIICVMHTLMLCTARLMHCRTHPLLSSALLTCPSHVLRAEIAPPNRRGAFNFMFQVIVLVLLPWWGICDPCCYLPVCSEAKL